MPDNNNPARIIVVFILAASLSVFFQACSKTTQAYLEAGKKHMEEGRYNEAFIEFRNATKKDAGFPEAHYQTGLLYMQLGAYSDALREMQATVGTDQNRMDAQIRIGNLLLMQRKYEEAREQAKLILSKTPDSLEAKILEANSWAGMIHINDSIQEIRKGIEREPQLGPPFLSLADKDGDKPDADKAEDFYRRIVDAADRWVTARLAMGNYYLLKGRDSEAGEQYEAAVRNDPKSRDAAFALGYFYLQSKRFAEAEEQYKKYVELSKGIPGIEVILPDFYLASGETDRGIQALEKMVADNPETGIFKKRLASVFFDRRDFDKAEALSDELIKKNAGDTAAHYLKGRILLTRNKSAEAVSHLLIVARRRPGYAPVRYFLGTAYMQNGDISKAASELELAVDLDPTLSQAQLSLARLKLEAGNTDEAIELTQKVLNRNLELKEAHEILGRAYARRLDYKNSVAEFENYLKARPSDAAVLYNLGQAYRAQGNFKAAEFRFNSALEANPNQTAALYALVDMYVAQKQPDKAIKRINQESEHGLDDSVSHDLLGRIYLGQNDYAKAEQEFQQAVSLDPKNPAYRRMLAELYLTTGDAGKAENILRKLIEENPGNMDIRKRLVNLYLNQNGTDKALRLIDETLKANPKETEIRLMKADILMAQNKSAESIREIQTAIENDPNSKQAYYVLGMAYIRDKKEEQSESAFNAAVRIDPRFIPAWRALAQLKLSGGDIDAAIQYGRGALKADPGAVEMRFLLAEGLIGRKSYKDAIAELNAYVSARPTDIRGLYRLGMAYMEGGNDAKAESALQNALGRNPGGVEPLSALVSMDLRRRQPQRAISRINAQIQKAPQTAGFYELLGKVYTDQGNAAKAEEAFRKQASMGGAADSILNRN